jgi:ribonucleoside-diphosphate reductase alpha chain
MYREQVLKTATEYFKGNELQANVWVDKYCLRNKEGNYLESTPVDMFHRLAKEFARIEKKYKNPLTEDEIFNLLDGFRFVIPGGSMLYGIANPYSLTSLGNCFVIGDQTDSYGSICKIDEEQVQLMKRRGGVGHDLSHLRPAGSAVNNAAATSTGAVSFMDRYSNSTREVAQGGRRGALMLTMDVNHADIDAFIESKSDLTKLTGCNISVKVTDDFMNKVKAGDEKANATWGKLVHQAWATAEPGVLFWDTIIRNSPADKYKKFQSVSTNPCGEIPLCPYDTCRLMSINLFSFVDHPFTADASFNHAKFAQTVKDAQRLMDDVIDLEEEKINKILKKIESDDIILINEDNRVEAELWGKIKEKLLLGRRTGLSCIGLADCLAALNIRYGSEESLDRVDGIFSTFKHQAYISSETMAKERGAFPAWDEKIDKVPRRNIALLTIPPSGTLAIMAGITSGIEPVFNLEYTRRRKVEDSENVAFVDKKGDKWEEYKVYHQKYEEYNRPESYTGATAHDISPLTRVKLQATVQKHIDHSISSTINLPFTATEEEIRDIYLHAWESGCKGVTVYRDGCRDGILINKKKVEFEQHEAPKRPKNLPCKLSYASIKGEKYCVLVGLLDEKPYELFAFNVNKDNFLLNSTYKYNITKIERGKYALTSEDGSHPYGMITEQLSDDQAAVTRLISTSLRHGANIKFIVEQLSKIEGDLTSFTKVLARILKTYIPDGETLKDAKCEECGSKLVLENGCVICKSCGFTKCG